MRSRLRHARQQHRPAEHGERRVARARGLTHLGVYERAGYKFGQWHSVGWWQLLLPLTEGDPAPPVPLPTLVEIEGFDHALAAGLPYLRD